MILVELSVERITPGGGVISSGQMSMAVTLRGRSNVPELSFTEVVYAYGDALQTAYRLQRHGSVVVPLSDAWRYEYDQQGGWLQHIFNEAFRVVRGLPADQERESVMQVGYDQNLADQILSVLNEIYPASFSSPMELKHQLGNEPEDKKLMTALDALLGDGLITGKEMREHTSGQRRLAMLAAIQITRHGRQSLQPQLSQPHSASIVHGDQFVNYGNMGAAGRNSSGVVLLKGDSASRNETLIKLDSLILELETARPQTPEIERAQREFHKVRDEIADEDSPNPSTLTKWLTRGKQLLATAALSQEVVEAAHKVYENFGIS